MHMLCTTPLSRIALVNPKYTLHEIHYINQLAVNYECNFVTKFGAIKPIESVNIVVMSGWTVGKIYNFYYI